MTQVERVRVAEEEFKRWKSADLYHHAQVFTIADCQNFYDEDGKVIAKHLFGGLPNYYEINEEYRIKEEDK